MPGRLIRTPISAAALSLGIAAVGCLPPPGPQQDGGMDAEPAPVTRPTLESLPERIPYMIATLRGSALGARRVVVEGTDPSGNPLPTPTASLVRPGGTFCVDVPLAAEGMYSFQVRAQAEDGRFSQPVGTDTTRDPQAPPIPNAQTCSGMPPEGCQHTRESGSLCTNRVDDDCDGAADEMDLDCQSCPDDALEPNDDRMSAPQIRPVDYSSLNVCPGDPDFYGIEAYPGQTIQARIQYMVRPMGELRMELLGPSGAAVATGTGTNGVKALDHTYQPPDGGGGRAVYTLRIRGSTETSTNRYMLQVRVSGP